jgi:hypothetical protein
MAWLANLSLMFGKEFIIKEIPSQCLVGSEAESEALVFQKQGPFYDFHYVW